jgi:CubicO group peptidase (beta-lactamase class C family)
LNPLQSKIRDLATTALGKHAGIVVGILRGGDQWTAGYGRCDALQQLPAEDAIFEIGSVTKVFTTLALADMVLRGEVALGDRAQKYLPGAVQMPRWRGQEITLFHLATHTSSLPRLPANLWTTVKDYANPYADYQVSDMYAFLSSYKLKRPVGSRVEYSNLGMGLLGHILGLAAGKTYEELIGERILRPLGMNHTSIALNPQQRERLAPGHTLMGKVTANWDIPALAGCGALRSTAGDLVRFMAANIIPASSSLAEAARLCQQLYPKTRKALPTGRDYALALLFSGLGIWVQWLFGLAPGDVFFVLAVVWPGIFAASHLGLAPGLLATATTLAGSYFLQHGHTLNEWVRLVVGGVMFSLFSFFAFRRPGLRDWEVMLGWQYQQLYPFQRSLRFIWHNGGTGGYASFVGFVRETETAVVVLANSAKSVDALGVEILKLMNRKASQGRIS